MYPEEILSEDHDDGTMVQNVEDLRSEVVGHRIVSAEQGSVSVRDDHWYTDGYRNVKGLVLTLDNGKRVVLSEGGDCCAYTGLQGFFLNPNSVDHVITGIGTTDEYQVWHVYADYGDILKLQVAWSAGNPFYYGYGFDITVIPEDQ